MMWTILDRKKPLHLLIKVALVMYGEMHPSNTISKSYQHTHCQLTHKEQEMYVTIQLNYKTGACIESTLMSLSLTAE